MAGNTEKLAFVQQERMWKAADEYMATGMQYTTAMKMARMDHLMMEPESEVMYKEQG
jgi:Holliday junction resolvase-like predicted endonuclease